MLTLRLFGHNISEARETANYYEVECERWEVVKNLLVIERADNERVYFPLAHISSFKEV